jgi:DNA modification methylase
MTPYYEQDGITIYHGDCRDVLPSLDARGVVIADPPYGIGVADWDALIDPASWLPLALAIGPTAVFCGVRGVGDYPRPDWMMAWVRVGSTQRVGKLRGFNNWEPILLYGIAALSNDVIEAPNTAQQEVSGHPSPKPSRLIRALLARLPDGLVVDPFMGTGTTLVEAKRVTRHAIGIDINERYCEMSAQRLAQRALPLELGA